MARGSLLLSEGLKDIERIQVGIDGKARKIKKAWVGIDGVARLCYEDSAQKQEYWRPGTYKSTPTYIDHQCSGIINNGNGWDPSDPNPDPSSVAAEEITLYVDQSQIPNYSPVSGTYDHYDYRNVKDGTRTYSYDYLGEETIYGVIFKKYNALVVRETLTAGYDRKHYYQHRTPTDAPAGMYPPIIRGPYESVYKSNIWKTSRIYFNQRLQITYIGTYRTSGDYNTYLAITYREHQYYDWQGDTPDPNLWEYSHIEYVDYTNMSKGAYQVWKEK